MGKTTQNELKSALPSSRHSSSVGPPPSHFRAPALIADAAPPQRQSVGMAARRSAAIGCPTMVQSSTNCRSDSRRHHVVWRKAPERRRSPSPHDCEPVRVVRLRSLHNEPLSGDGTALTSSLFRHGFSGFVAKAERRGNFMDALQPISNWDRLIFCQIFSLVANKALAFPRSAGILSADRNPTARCGGNSAEGRKAERSRRSVLRLSWRRFFYSNRA